jgi:hypothetical protein
MTPNLFTYVIMNDIIYLFIIKLRHISLLSWQNPLYANIKLLSNEFYVFVIKVRNTMDKKRIWQAQRRYVVISCYININDVQHIYLV